MEKSRLFDQYGVKYAIIEPEDFGNLFLKKIYANSIKLEQVHGNIITVSGGKNKFYPGADGIVSDFNEYIGVRTADCLPVLMSPKNKNFAIVVHAGWKGLQKGIMNLAWKTALRFGSSGCDMLAYIGPHIKSCCYEVSSRFLGSFRSNDPVYYCVKKNTEGKIHFDLEKFAAIQLLQQGIRKDNLEISDRCTCCDPHLPSYRRDRNNKKRLYSLIACDNE